MHKPMLVKPDIRDTAALLAYSKQLYGTATMTAPDQPPTPPTPAPPAPPAPEPEKTLTQSEVNRIAAREKDEGRNAALKEVQEALGVDLETAKNILKEHNERTEAAKTEAQRAKEAADAEKAAAATEKSEAAKETHAARVTTQFVLAGVTDEAKITKYSKLLDVEVGAKPEDIKAAVEKLKTEEPALFSGSVTPSRPPAPGSDPKGGPPKPKTDESAFDRGRERAKAKASGGASYATATPAGA